MALTDKLKNIANAVRAKTGGTSALTLDQMASTLNAIPNRSSSDLSVSGATVIAPAGNYKAQASKSLPTPANSSNITLASTDGRKVVVGKNDSGGIGGYWVVTNSDNVSRICAAIPTDGYYSTSNIIGIPATSVLTHMTSSANATASYLLEDYTAYVKGNKIAGTMLNRCTVGRNGAIAMSSNYPTVAVTPTDYNLQISANTDGVQRLCVVPPSGFYNGYHYVGIPLSSLPAIEPDLVAGNIKKGVNIFGVTGTYDTSSAVGALYYQGNQCVSNSGGWRGRAWVWGGSITNTITPTITHNSDHMLINVGRGNLVAGAVEVVNDQNLTGVNQIAIDFEASTYAYIIRLIVIPRSTYYMDEAIATVDLQPYGDSQTLSRRTIALDVSGINGSYDIAIAFINAWTDNCSATMKVYSVIKR